jgi:hypothetical protein
VERPARDAHVEVADAIAIALESEVVPVLKALQLPEYLFIPGGFEKRVFPGFVFESSRKVRIGRRIVGEGEAASWSNQKRKVEHFARQARSGKSHL